ATGWTVLWARGAPSETRLVFAGLGDLLRPLQGRLDELPPIRADVLRSVIDLGQGEVLAWLAPAVSTLELLALAADERPLLVLVDDLHWLDRESGEALTFVARRLDSERIAMIFAARADELDRPLVTHLPVHPIAALSFSDARVLLTRESGTSADLDV